jgi:hypothetical protein
VRIDLGIFFIFFYFLNSYVKILVILELKNLLNSSFVYFGPLILAIVIYFFFPMLIGVFTLKTDYKMRYQILLTIFSPLVISHIFFLVVIRNL